LLKGKYYLYQCSLLKRKCGKYFTDYFGVILIFL
jgi:hypothetical protein